MLSHHIHNIDIKIYQKYFLNKRSCNFCEIGIRDSISYFFEKKLNWTGIIIQGLQENLINVNRNCQLYNCLIGNQNLIKCFIKNKKIYQYNIFGSEKRNIQTITYQNIIQDKIIDLLIINEQYKQKDIITSILNTNNKPQFILMKIKYNKDIILSIIKDYYTLEENIQNDYYFFKKKDTILLITRCTRINNLSIIKNSIEKAFQNQNINYIWYIIVEGKKVSEEEYDKYITLLQKENIIYQYKLSTGHYLFSGQFLNIAINDKRTKMCNYSYILDDDNILHENFIKLLKNNISDKEQVIVINLQNLLGDMNNIPLDCRGKIDSASYLVRMDILKQINGYQLTPSFIKTGWAEDALTFKTFLEKNIPIFYTHKICGYHNGIDLIKFKN